MEEKKPMEQDEVLDPTDFEDDESEKEEGTDNLSEEGDTTDESTDSTEKSAEELEKEEKEKKAKRDSHFAKLRREKEAKEKAEREQRDQNERERKIREEATLQAKLELQKVNPYTNEPITDAEDLKVFEMMRQLDEEGKNPISDLPKRLAEVNRKNAEDARKIADEEARTKLERQNKINDEIAELREKYPDVNTAKLADDELFKELLNSRAGRWTQVEIYELYLVEKAKRDAEDKAKKSKDTIEKGGKRISKTPSSSAGGSATSKSVADMTQEEFEEYWSNKYGS